MTRARPGRRGVLVTCSVQAGRPAAARGLARWLERAAPARARGSAAIALLSDARMRQLNRDFRGVDRPTDVLSFPAAGPGRRTRARRTPEPEPRTLNHRTPEPVANSSPIKYLGDLAIALGLARRQAREQGHSLATELRILALHGLLHLLGYDHERDHGDMRRLEERLRRRAGLPGGLIVRASSRSAGP